jgi:quercetin dioxygenase-like cupin family protein
MQITRNSIETMAGPPEWFTGTVHIDAVAAPSEQSRLQTSSVHFTPGARTAWHTHPNGQTIYVTEGIGLAQRRGGPIETPPRLMYDDPPVLSSRRLGGLGRET